MNYDDSSESQSFTEEDKNLIKYIINQAECHEDGRLILPCLWDEKVKHLLPNNYKLASNILKSNIKKLTRDSNKFEQYNNVFMEQLQSGIIEKVFNYNNEDKENGNKSLWDIWGSLEKTP